VSDPPRIVLLRGSAYDQGLQHAAAIPPAQRRCLERLIELEHPGAASTDLLACHRRDAPETVATIEGLAEGLGQPFEQLWAYTARSYVSELAAEGCSVAARSGRQPLLGKNRDFSLAHLPLQSLIAVAPSEGYPWLSLGSLGSPGVYSSGMNAAGLALADTYVPARKVGPGVLRYSLMQQVLERCADVPSGVDHLLSAAAVGCGTVTLADETGELACVELAHNRVAVRRPGRRGWLTASNHYRHPRLRQLNRFSAAGDDDSASSRARATRLRRAGPPASAQALLELLASHGDQQTSLCRHRYGPEGERATLASTVYFPAERRAIVRLGRPCEAADWQVAWNESSWTVKPLPTDCRSA
jgi:hypothetical protein